jgi:Tfp pilus assembly protein PilE
MRRKLGNQAGMSLVEATIILMVLAILTSVIAPSIGDYVEESRQVKAKEDVEAIGTGILRLLHDTGLPCLSTVATPTISTACTLVGRVDVVESTGTAPVVSAAAVTLPSGSHGNTANASNNWPGSTSGNGVDTNPGGGDDTNVGINLTDSLDDQLVTNAVPYTAVAFTGGGGPRNGVGWRGAYLTGLTGGDPWGYKYYANTIFLTTASNATAGTTEGLRSAGWTYDVIVISAGSNSSIDTPLMSANTSASIDDVIYTISGSSR